MDDKYEPPFTAQDHTKLVGAVMEKPLHVIKYLDLPPGRGPTTQEVLEAALQVRSFDPATKARLKDAAAAFAALEQERSGDEAAFNERQDRVRAAADGKPVEEKIAALDDLLARQDFDERSVAGLRLARDILVDGADSIYSSESAFNELLPDPVAAGAVADAAPASGHTTGAQQVAQVDAEFASAGGGGSAAGAAAGAASIGAALSVVYDAFFA